jgi:hypothetical protein
MSVTDDALHKVAYADAPDANWTCNQRRSRTSRRVIYDVALTSGGGTMNAVTPRADQSAQALAGGFADEIRRLYLEALRFEGSLDSLVAGRRAAEAVCQQVAELLPENLRRTCAAKELPSRIGILEDNGVLPRQVSAALRALAAYGNYAAHYESGTHQAPPDAARSAMASLSLVATWVLKRSRHGDGDEQPILPLREPPAAVPGVLERFRLSRKVPFKPELTERSTNLESYQHSVSPDAPRAIQFARLMAFYEDSIDVVSHVCRQVLSRETWAKTDALTFEQLIMSMALVSEARPIRVPRSICLDLESLSTFRSAIAQRLSSTADPAPFLLQAKTQNVAERVLKWFDSTYLGRSSLERRGVTAGFICVGLFCIAYVGNCAGHESGSAEAHDAIQTQLCGRTAHESLATFCAPPASAAAPKK